MTEWRAWTLRELTWRADAVDDTRWWHTAAIRQTVANTAMGAKRPRGIQEFHPLEIARDEAQRRRMAARARELAPQDRPLTEDEKQRIWQQMRSGD